MAVERGNSAVMVRVFSANEIKKQQQQQKTACTALKIKSTVMIRVFSANEVKKQKGKKKKKNSMHSTKNKWDYCTSEN